MSRFSRGLLYLITAGVVFALAKVHAAAIGEYDLTSSSRLAWSTAYVALLCVAAYGAGLPDLPRTLKAALATAGLAVGGAAVGISLAQLAVGSALLPRFVVFFSAALLIPIYALVALMTAGGHDRASERERIVVVGDDDEVITLLDDVAHAPERAFTVAWALTPAEARGDHDGDVSLLEAATDSRAAVVVLARTAQNDDAIVAQAAILHERGVRVRTLTLFYDEWLGKLPAGELERMSLMFDIGEIHRIRYGRVKRILDIVGGLAALPVLAAAVPFVLAGNLVANRGPLLYRQPRVGKGGRTFQILKFRTMRPGAGPTTWTTDRDPRVTRFGALLRKTHLDELPQAVNMIRGDLSIVGPRPEQPHYVDELNEKIPFYRLRHLVRPGLTGWAQVKYPYGASELDALEKLQYEFFYLRHQSLALDLRIIGRTLRHVLSDGGR